MDLQEIQRAFKSPKLLVDHSRRHLADLEAALTGWENSKPYTLVMHFDPESGTDVYKIRLANGVPDAFSLSAFDIATSLRSALDQSVYASAVCFGAAEPKNTHFPFADSEGDVDTAISKGRSRDAPADIKPLLRSFNPYSAGNRTLWALNKMRNVKNHRLLIEPGIGTNGVELVPMGRKPGQTHWSFPGIMRFDTGPWDRNANEKEIFRCGHNPNVDFNLEVTSYIAVGDVDGLRGEPLIAAFHELAGVIEGIVLAIEAETIRLLP